MSDSDFSTWTDIDGVDGANVCGKCEKVRSDVQCTCGEVFCQKCFVRHIQRLPTHREVSSSFRRAWSWVSGKVSGLQGEATRIKHFQEDEITKWFGLHVEDNKSDRITRIVETPRFTELAEKSATAPGGNPIRQFPSLVSFVGEAGVGKSTLIRTLIWQAADSMKLPTEELDAPIPGSSIGPSAHYPTSGEVSLYSDPATFGTPSPRFYADSEGMLGSEPACAKHQSEWHKSGRKYLIHGKNGKEIDRSMAVKDIYPRFLYIFSDVVCLITRNQKAWAETALMLLEWSNIGAHNTVNQYALPAAIIVLNQPTIEEKRWISDNQEAATTDFFLAVDKEIKENSKLRAMATENGDKTMWDLFHRNFSSVHVHYVPLQGYGNLGTADIIFQQNALLSKRIQEDSDRVQREREIAWMRFDSAQFSIVVDFAFKHFARGDNVPFNFSECRRRTDVPETLEGHLTRFLKYYLGMAKENFSSVAALLSSCLVRRTLEIEGMGLVYSPSVIFDGVMRRRCSKALENFLEQDVECAFSDPASSERCVNTKSGHAKGHQNRFGSIIGDGNFMSSDIDINRFLQDIEESVADLLRKLNEKSSNAERRIFALNCHREILRTAAEFKEQYSEDDDSSGLFATTDHDSRSELGSASTCLSCLFQRPEYRLPCGHLICKTCVRDFGRTEKECGYPDQAVHRLCILCATDEPSGQWPWKMGVTPRLSGLRVLSLDGGGVRGIVQLEVMKRLEEEIGLEIPLWNFFDLIGGTSAGGLIALGMGVHKWDSETCIKRFKSICRDGFKENFLANNALFGWGIRWVRGSIYKTQALENILQSIYSQKNLFGISQNSGQLLPHCPRVAVITTINSESKLLTNYNRGDSDKAKYISSEVMTWQAARCTSAAPIYFEPYSHVRGECYDGGLQNGNNPIQAVLNEKKAIWGPHIPFDMILSIGSGVVGTSEKPGNPPDILTVRRPVEKWVANHYNRFMTTLNGNEEWEAHKRNTDDPRSRRLNVQLGGQKEPGLDAVDKVEDMQKIAQSYKFHQTYAPLVKPFPGNSLREIALCLRASLFFLEIQSLKSSSDNQVTVIKGVIHCRLRAGTDALRLLLDKTRGFQTSGPPGVLKSLESRNSQIPFKLDVDIQHESEKDNDLLRLEVQFMEDREYMVTVSGFPCTLKDLKRRLEDWEQSK